MTRVRSHRISVIQARFHQERGRPGVSRMLALARLLHVVASFVVVWLRGLRVSAQPLCPGSQRGISGCGDVGIVSGSHDGRGGYATVDTHCSVSVPCRCWNFGRGQLLPSVRATRRTRFAEARESKPIPVNTGHATTTGLRRTLYSGRGRQRPSRQHPRATQGTIQ